MTNLMNNLHKNIKLTRVIRSFWSEVSNTRSSCTCLPNSNIRVRFAPSPTGFLHLGGLRTALYNYLFAKAHRGSFILRIEDTDQTRLVPGAVEKLERDLQWCGLHPDESPSVNGNFGPYSQSQRLDFYNKHIQTLLENGSAYYCFCTEKRLDLLRRDAARRREVPKYDNRCRHLSKDVVATKLSKGEPYCIRFKLEPVTEPFMDAVYGPILYNVAEHEGDPVIIKNDGFPTYHFANVVDDHMMEISHVLRGVEWQISTTKHLLLYRAFGWTPPVYAHLPLILNADGSKLSKRQNGVHVEYFQSAGFFPEAVLNFITNSGGGFESREVECSQTLEDLISKFRIERMNTNSCHLDLRRLYDFNRLELQKRMLNESSLGTLVEEVRKQVKLHFGGRLADSAFQEKILGNDNVKSVLIWSQNRITRIADLLNKDLEFIWVIPSRISFDGTVDDPVYLLEETRQHLQSQLESDFTQEKLSGVLRNLASCHHVAYSKLMKLLRMALSGLKQGPGVTEVMEILGKPSTIERLEHAVQIIKKGT